MIGSSNATPKDEKFVNFLLHCSDFNNLEFKNFRSIPLGTEIYAVQLIESGKGFSDYVLKKYKLMVFDEFEKYIEVADEKGKYEGIFLFSNDGNPIYSLNKNTGMPDVFEKTFLDYISALRYMSHLKYICDVSEDAILLKILQQINKIHNRGK